MSAPSLPDQPEVSNEHTARRRLIAHARIVWRSPLKRPILSVTCGLVAVVIGLVSLGLANKWGVAQFGAVSNWVFGSVTLAALGLAFIQSRRSIRESAKSERRIELQRQIDHGIDRRRETSKALADLWSVIAAEGLSVVDVLNFFDDLPYSFDPNIPRGDGTSTVLAVEIHDAIKAFIENWMRRVEGSMLYALIVTKGTKLDEPTRRLNEDIRTLLDAAIPALARFALTEHHIPETRPVREYFSSITKRRQEFLDLMREHLALDWDSVTEAVVESLAHKPS